MERIPFPNKRAGKKIALEELAILERTYPDALTALQYRNAFELLIAVVLSAQNTDARVNLTTPALFKKYPTPQKLARANPQIVEGLIRSCGFFRTKAKNIIAASKLLVERHGGEVPASRESLEALPGVGRKSASVVLSVVFEEAEFAVDTHVFRVSHRLGLTRGKTPRDVETDVTKLVPKSKWRHAHHWLILHGRQICKAPRPKCAQCPVKNICPTPPIIEKMNALKRNGSRSIKMRRTR
ncbi:MAG: endonuclease III [Vulcanimicrobiaceae bacterium]